MVGVYADGQPKYGGRGENVVRKRHSAGRRKRSRDELAVRTSSGRRPERRYRSVSCGRVGGGAGQNSGQKVGVLVPLWLRLSTLVLDQDADVGV